MATSTPQPPDLENNPQQPPSSPSPPSSSKSPPLPPPSLPKRTRTFLATPVTPSHADLLLLACCFISGLVDSTIYAAFGTFVSMQTGNTVFLGLGGSTSHSTSKPYGWAKSFVSIICFCIGCMAFSHLSRWLGGLKRGTLALSFGVQSLIVLVSAAVVQGGAVNGRLDEISDDIDWMTVIPIALLSFQSAGQIVGSRTLGISEVPTVVITSMLHDIMTDPKLLAGKENVKRNRRVAAFFLLLAGAIAGGFMAEGTDRMQLPLWLAGGIKSVITVAWLFWPEGKVLGV